MLRGVPHYSWQFPTEQFFVDQLHQHTRVPVPYPYMVDLGVDIFGWSFVLMPRLPGISLSDKPMVNALPIEDRLAIARLLARTLAEAHALTWECSGKYDPETRQVKPFDEDYGSWVVKSLREKLDRARGCNHHTRESDLQWAEAMISNARDSLTVPFTPCAVLSDYGEHNVVVERGTDGWRVSGVFDLMTAHFGDGDADLCMPVAQYFKTNPALASAFIETYQQNRPARPGFFERQRVYTLGLYASMWAYWQRAEGGPPENPAVGFEQWARPVVDFWSGSSKIT